MKDRTTTIESLVACFKLLSAESKDEVAAYYKAAIHDSCGDFEYISTTPKKRGRKPKPKVPKVKKELVARHWYTDGKVNMKVPECPPGFHPGKVGKFRNMYGDCWR